MAQNRKRPVAVRANGASIQPFSDCEDDHGCCVELDPGALCTLHWHPDADKWQYVIEGEVSATLFASHGRYRAEGDVGYIPQGYGHSIENVGSGAARILIGFNAGVYGRSICRNVSRPTPGDVLATNFRQPAELFGKFSDRDVSIAASGGT